MDEAVEKAEIMDGILSVASASEKEKIETCNFRKALDGTRQALIEVTTLIAACLLKITKIKIEWFLCRIRKKAIEKI